MQKQRKKRRRKGKKREGEGNNRHIFSKVSDHFTKDDLWPLRRPLVFIDLQYTKYPTTVQIINIPQRHSLNDFLTFQNMRGEACLSSGIHVSVGPNFLENSQEENNKVITITKGLCFWSKEVLLGYWMKSRWEECPTRPPVTWVQKPQGDLLLYRFPLLSESSRTPTPKSKWHGKRLSYLQFSSVTESCPTLCDPMNHRTPGLLVHHELPEFTQTHVHQVRDAIQPSHPLSSPSPPAPNPSQHQSLFQWVNSSHEVAKVLELQL